MSTSLLYHGFGVRGYRHCRTDYINGEVIFTIEQDRSKLRCPTCGSARVQSRGEKLRLFRTVPIGGKPVFVVLGIPRVLCHHCQVQRQVEVPFADPRRRYTHLFERYALDLSRQMTISAVAKHLGVSWDTIKDIQKRHLLRHYAKPRLKDLRRIAIDEISVAKGHRYLTVVMDLEQGTVVFVGDGKGQAALEPFWRRLRASHARVQAVAIDMSRAYISAVHKNLPHATLVFDHFHVIKLFNEKLSEFRRALYHELTDKLGREVLKGTRWLLLKNPENLDDEKDEWQRLQDALDLNAPLATVYYMKEDLRQFWDQPDKTTARRVLGDWIKRATASGIRVLQQMADTLGLWRNGLFGYYDHPISTGPLEGINNKIKTMNRQAYGFRDQDFFKLKILGIHETHYELVG